MNNSKNKFLKEFRAKWKDGKPFSPTEFIKYIILAQNKDRAEAKVLWKDFVKNNLGFTLFRFNEESYFVRHGFFQ
jgi:hypothetical protein